jgi:hypothetical protein
VVVQPITGLALIHYVGYRLGEHWTVLSIVLYLATGAFWLPVVWIQVRMRDLAAEAVAEGKPLPDQYTDCSAGGSRSASRPRRGSRHLLADDRAAARDVVAAGPSLLAPSAGASGKRPPT